MFGTAPQSRSHSRATSNPIAKQANTSTLRPAVQRRSNQSIQRQLKISRADDAAEREADSVADQVMRMPTEIQRACACSGEPENTTIQRHADGDTRGGSQVSQDESSTLASLRGGGSPLPASERSFFEPRFGADLGGVRIHTGSTAAGLAQSFQARAFTIGRDVAFAPGAYQPGTQSGRRLLAHELTHTMQQGAVVARAAPQPQTVDPIVLRHAALNQTATPGHGKLQLIARHSAGWLIQRYRRGQRVPGTGRYMTRHAAERQRQRAVRNGEIVAALNQPGIPTRNGARRHVDPDSGVTVIARNNAVITTYR